MTSESSQNIWKDIYEVRGCVALPPFGALGGAAGDDLLMLGQGIRGKHVKAKFIQMERHNRDDPKAIFLCYDQHDRPLPCQIVGFVQAVNWVIIEDERIDQLNATTENGPAPEIQT